VQLSSYKSTHQTSQAQPQRDAHLPPTLERQKIQSTKYKRIAENDCAASAKEMLSG
jgi:hypothetical protein